MSKDDDVYVQEEPSKKKNIVPAPSTVVQRSIQEQEVSVHKDKVRLLCTQNNPSEGLILLALDELARKAKDCQHYDADTYEELLRQASRNQGEINIVTLTLNVLGGKASDLVSKTLSKCLKEKDCGKAESNPSSSDSQQMDMTSPLAVMYPPMMPQGYNPMDTYPPLYMPYGYEYKTTEVLHPGTSCNIIGYA